MPPPRAALPPRHPHASAPRLVALLPPPSSSSFGDDVLRLAGSRACHVSVYVHAHVQVYGLVRQQPSGNPTLNSLPTYSVRSPHSIVVDVTYSRPAQHSGGCHGFEAHASYS